MPHFLNIGLMATAIAQTLLLTQPSFTTSQKILNGDTRCGPLSELGTSNWERFSASASLTVTPASKDCDYSLTFKFKHDPSLPLPTNAADCVPGATAPDGVHFLGFRWHYERLPAYFKEATGVDHISLDFNPCGHPPENVFTVPHYDVHLYLVSPKDRTCMTCEMIPGTPVCDPYGQTTENGRAFFNTATVQPGGKLANMPDGFEFGLNDVVPLMGGHSWKAVTQPDLTTKAWKEPIWIMGSYDGAITNFEPMLPLTFVKGKKDKSYVEDLTYVSQTAGRLPFRYTVSYNGSTGFTMITMVGKSALCGKKFKKAKKDSKSHKRRGRR